MKKLSFKSLLLMAALCVTSVMSAQMPGQAPAAPVDSAVITGKLDNGLTYYIRHNDSPKGQADFYIAQKVGSVLEEENQLLPNTSGVRNAEEAVFAAQMAREAFGTNWLKLEIHPDPRYLLPDSIETLKATEQLVKLGFVVLPYCQADPTLCKHLEEAGAATVMPLAAPIGTNKGLRMKDFLQIIIEQATVPVVVDAGIGAPSHAAEAMEMGADCCLVNTAIAVAGDPVQMADAFRQAVIAGRQAYEAGLGAVADCAEASSPLTAFLN